MKMKSVFKSPELRDRILARYNEILAAFPFEKKYVDTSFGRTFVLATGAPENPPVILLHGACSNSAFWFGELMALSPTHHVLAVDIPGEAGNSADNRLDLRTEDYADWLKDVFLALGIEHAAVAGNSLGGWMALRFATKYPERVTKLALIAPGGLSGVHEAVFERARRAEAEGTTLSIDSSLAGGAELPAPVIEFMNLILSGFNPIAEGLPIFGRR
jgi:pimeloyl-ACP methyl ester carboxylesterase